MPNVARWFSRRGFRFNAFHLYSAVTKLAFLHADSIDDRHKDANDSARTQAIYIHMHVYVCQLYGEIIAASNRVFRAKRCLVRAIPPRSRNARASDIMKQAADRRIPKSREFSRKEWSPMFRLSLSVARAESSYRPEDARARARNSDSSRFAECKRELERLTYIFKPRLTGRSKYEVIPH